MKTKAVTLLVDGMNILHRGFYATPPMTNAAGEPTNAIRGFVNIMLADIKLVKATHVAVVFDRPGKNFRHRLYPEYKANRPVLDGVDMRTMVAPTRRLLTAMGIQVFGKNGIECDDLIGSLAVRMSKLSDVYIASNDKDFGSLVNTKVFLLKPKGVILDAAGIKEEYGVHPHQMVDYLTMLGDKVDNIPGINKVGPKTASKLLEQYGTLDKIYAKAKYTVKMQANFDAAKAFIPTARKLITLDTTRLSNVTLDRIQLAGLQPELKAICAHLDFKSTHTSIINTLG